MKYVMVHNQQEADPMNLILGTASCYRVGLLLSWCKENQVRSKEYLIWWAKTNLCFATI